MPRWHHQLETFSALLALCAGNSPITGEFPSQRPVTRGLDVFLMCVWMNDWVNNREAGGLRGHRTHYDVRVMRFVLCLLHHQVLGQWWLCCTIKGHIMALYFIQYNDRCIHIAPIMAVSEQTWHASEGFASGCMYILRLLNTQRGLS